MSTDQTPAVDPLDALMTQHGGTAAAPAGGATPVGQLEPGNIDLATRPHVQNADGTVSTVRSMSFEDRGREVLIPTVSDDGTILSDDAAVAAYRATGKHLGVFDSVDHANAYAEQLHQDQAAQVGGAADPLDAFMQARGAVTPDFTSTNEKDPAGNAVVGRDPRAMLADAAGDVAVGAAKGLGHSVTGLGKIILAIPGFAEGLDDLYGEEQGFSRRMFEAADRELEPSNTAQTIGKVGEQIGEVLIPGRAITEASTSLAAKVAPMLEGIVGKTAANVIPKAVVEGAANAGMAKVQGGDPGVAAVIGAAAPVVGAAMRGAPAALRDAATKKVVRALGPTKEKYKAIAERLAPQMLKRGLIGSRQSLATQAEETLERVGNNIEATLLANAGRDVDTTPVMAALEKAKAAFQTVRTVPLKAAVAQGIVTIGKTGKAVVAKKGARIVGADVEVPVIFDQRPIDQLTDLQRIIGELGRDVPVDKLVALRRAWDSVVSQAGGFAHRAPGGIGLPLKEQTEAWAKREATGAIRKILAADVPELATLNKEYAFWKGLDDVLTQTLQRTQPHGAGIGSMMAEGAGQVAGATLGATHGVATGVGGAFALGKLTGVAKRVFTSPRWQLVDANLRDRLATAIASNNVSKVATALARISAVQGSKIPAAVAVQ
jgi:hypothetical protein